MFNFLKDKLKAAISGLTKKAETEIEKSAKISLKEGAVAGLMEGFGNRYITPYALALGSSNFYIALIRDTRASLKSFFKEYKNFIDVLNGFLWIKGSLGQESHPEEHLKCQKPILPGDLFTLRNGPRRVRRWLFCDGHSPASKERREFGVETEVILG